MSKRVIIVSNRLPVTVSKQEGELSFQASAGGLATGLGSVYKEGENLWIGWPGFHDYDESEKDSIIDSLNNDNMAPVFLSKADVRDYYEGFSNRTLWPLFHYFTEFVQYDANLWEAYVRVNEVFCDEILNYAGEEDVIWVHDYQLLLLPDMLRKRLPNATIGFFQHIPFPSFEIFRLLPWREKILEGLLGSDLIGFHTYDDMRHFLSSVSRIMGHSHKMGELMVGNRVIKIDSFPMGIDYDKFSNAPKSQETRDKLARYQKMFSSQRIILSIDRLDYSKGIKQRLTAFDAFLTEHTEYIGQVSLVLLVVPSRDKVDQYQQLKEEIDTIVGRLNGKYNRMDWTPIHYFYRSFSFASLSALYSLADVALVTPLRDGMNLVAKEFVASRLTQKGVLILSEMAGASKELSEAILVNPNDIEQIVSAIHQAFTMPEEEQTHRLAEMQETVKRYNIHRWVEMFMSQLEAIKAKQQKLDLKLISTKSTKKIIDKYKAAKERVLFLDYDGTLKGFTKDPKAASPDKELLALLEKLTSDPANRVVVISGRGHETLEEWLGHLPLEMIAEHGVWIKKHEQDWQTIDELTFSWKPQVRSMLEKYVDRTPGSFIEDKDYSLVWHYRNADIEFGELRARELVGNLNYLILNMGLQTLEGNKVIEIKSQDVNKGRAARKYLSDKNADFIIAFGDDVTDEDTFKSLPEDAFTIKVGQTASAAKMYIKSFTEVRELLATMANA